MASKKTISTAKKKISKKEIITAFSDFIINFHLLSENERKAIISKTFPVILGSLNEWGYCFDWMIDMEDILTNINR